jgi:hypothetical protein
MSPFIDHAEELRSASFLIFLGRGSEGQRRSCNNFRASPYIDTSMLAEAMPSVIPHDTGQLS